MKDVTLSDEELCIIVSLVRDRRKNILNNRIQSKNPDKDHLFVYQATVIDNILDKLR